MVTICVVIAVETTVVVGDRVCYINQNLSTDQMHQEGYAPTVWTVF